MGRAASSQEVVLNLLSVPGSEAADLGSEVGALDSEAADLGSEVGALGSERCALGAGRISFSCGGYISFLGGLQCAD